MTREEAIKILSNLDGHGIPSGYNGGYAEAIDLAIKALYAEPKHGRWIKRGDNSWECSVCHEISCCNGNYCVDCGARMDEVEE